MKSQMTSSSAPAATHSAKAPPANATPDQNTLGNAALTSMIPGGSAIAAAGQMVSDWWSGSDEEEAESEAESTSGATQGVGPIASSPPAAPEAPAVSGGRKVAGEGGYVYQQFPDGTIVILEGPGAPKMLKPTDKANIAITAEIGPYPTSQPELPAPQVGEKSPEPEPVPEPPAEKGFVEGLVDDAAAAGQAAVDLVSDWWAGGSESCEGVEGETEEAPEEGAAVAPVVEEPQYEVKTQTREELIAAYNAWLGTRTTEVAALTGEAQITRIVGLLDQAEDVFDSLNSGVMVDVDKLNTAPTSGGKVREAGYCPPEMIGTVRKLVALLELDPAAKAEAAADGEDWNARLGVPQYRNQNDNLVGSYVSCNVTSASMAYERLGYSREDVLAAVKRELGTTWVRVKQEEYAKANGTAMPKPEVDALTESGPDDAFVEAEVTKYFNAAEAEQMGGSSYRGMRSGKDAELSGKDGADDRAELAKTYLDDAQMEDLLDFLMQLHYQNGGFDDVGKADMGGVRRSVATEGVGTELLGLIDPEAAADGSLPQVEQITGAWKDSKPKLDAVLKAGGSAQIGVRHKEKGSDEGHLVAAQAVTSSGVIIDDPYGKIGADFDHATSTQGAYKKDNGGGSNAVDADVAGEVGQDWTWRAAQTPGKGEDRGKSSNIPDAQMSTMLKYVTLYHRGGAKKE